MNNQAESQESQNSFPIDRKIDQFGNQVMTLDLVYCLCPCTDHTGSHWNTASNKSSKEPRTRCTANLSSDLLVYGEARSMCFPCFKNRLHMSSFYETYQGNKHFTDNRTIQFYDDFLSWKSTVNVNYDISRKGFWAVYMQQARNEGVLVNLRRPALPALEPPGESQQSQEGQDEDTTDDPMFGGPHEGVDMGPSKNLTSLDYFDFSEGKNRG
ncbi:uncharacterized protein L201_007485 [Kwoniella dendrophila CBS 6074]|uniref:Uncharacterized protein n=1 Tax=Kwoniella dendrophila CBS 6074 TaxID=1295534 RepID=A0AAX4K4I5_9TREE